MSTLTLGRTKEGISIGLDIEQLLRSRLLVQASSGGGKSSLMRLIAEHTGNTQFFVLDPEGEFFTLREEVKGLLIVGQRGDLQADPKTAKVLARRLLEIGASAVIDLSDLQLPQRRQYVRFFIESLMSAPQSLQHDLLIFIDESHMFCPERSAGDAESTAAVIDLMSRGRKRKFAGILATQRLSKLHKDAAAECANVLIGRTTLDVDQKRAIDMLGMSSGDRRTLRDLAVGEFFGFGPALDHPGVVQLRALLPATKEPQRGANSTRVAPASSQVQRMITELTDLAKKDEDKPVTIEDAEITISKLRRELNAKPKPEADEAKIAERVATALTRRDGHWQGLLSIYEKAFKDLQAQNVKAHKILTDAIGLGLPDVTNTSANVTNPPKPVTNAAQSARKATVSLPAKNLATSGEPLPKAERKILTVLAQRHPRTTGKKQLAVLTEYKHSGGGFNNALGSLRSKGYAVGSDPIEITDDGLMALGEYTPLPTGLDLVEYWLPQFGKAERAILSTVRDAYPNSISKSDLASTAGYEVTGGGFNNALGKLRTYELIQGSADIKLSDNLFD